MKNIFFRVTSILLLAVLLLPNIALSANLTSYFGTAYEQFPELAREFNVDLDIISRDEISVTEDILYDYKEQERHGIFRTINTSLSNSDEPFRVTNVSVSDENGNPYKFEVTENFNSVVIKIGSADEFVTGGKRYLIKYVAKGVNLNTDQDFIWNVTDPLWDVPIVSSEVQISGLAESISGITCNSTGDEEISNCEVDEGDGQIIVRSTDPIYPPAYFKISFTSSLTEYSSNFLFPLIIVIVIAVAFLVFIMKRPKINKEASQSNDSVV